MANVKKRRRTKAQLSPAEIVRRLSALYGEPVWRPHGDPMAELVLTILSQNTSDTNSGRAFMRVLRRFPDWRGLMQAPLPPNHLQTPLPGPASQQAPPIHPPLHTTI